MSTEQEDKDRKKANLTITVDNKSNEKLIELIEKERAEKEAEEEEPSLERLKLNLIAAHGRADLWTQATSKEMLKAMFENWVNENAEKANPKGTPSGSAPLNNAQYGVRDDLYTRKFENEKAMVDELFRLKHEGSKEASSYIDELERLWLTGKRVSPKLDDTYNPNVKENLPALKPVQGTTALTPVNKDEGDIASILAKWKIERNKKKEIEMNKQ